MFSSFRTTNFFFWSQLCQNFNMINWELLPITSTWMIIIFSSLFTYYYIKVVIKKKNFVILDFLMFVCKSSYSMEFGFSLVFLYIRDDTGLTLSIKSSYVPVLSLVHKMEALLCLINTLHFIFFLENSHESFYIGSWCLYV